MPIQFIVAMAVYAINERMARLKSSGVKCAPILAHSPNCNPHVERFVKTIRSECLDHFVIIETPDD